MDKRRIMQIAGILMAIAGLISLAFCIFRDGEKQILIAGLACNSIAFVISCIANRKKKGN